MKSKRFLRKALKKILDALREPAPLSTNTGPLIRGSSRYLSRKDKKHSGWVTPRFVKDPGMKYREAIQEALEPQVFWDEWKSWKDGFRNWYVDASHFKKGMNGKKYSPYIKEWQKPDHINKKLKKELEIRKAAKLKKENNKNL